MQDVEKWLGRNVKILRSDKFGTIDEVFEARRYLAGIRGAPCTTEMKKLPRLNYQKADDIHVFGYTADEGVRIARFVAAYPETYVEWLLQERGLTKADCLSVLKSVGIALPKMYQLGFQNNNCLGCVKATSLDYWDKVRRYFPKVFARRVDQSEKFGVRLTRYQGKRIFLRDLPKGPFRGKGETISCGPDCGIASFPDSQ